MEKFIINKFDELSITEQEEVQDFISGLTPNWEIVDYSIKDIKQDLLLQFINKIMKQIYGSNLPNPAIIETHIQKVFMDLNKQILKK